MSGSRTLRKRSSPTVIVHMTAAEYAAHTASEQRAQARGCAILAGVVALGAAVTYWYVAVPLLIAAAVAIVLLRRRRSLS